MLRKILVASLLALPLLLVVGSGSTGADRYAPVHAPGYYNGP
jgi:hypothetical protein